jgi:hypothetical protein
MKIKIFVILATFLLIGAVSVSATESNSQLPLEQRLIGTWQWDGPSDWVIIFREDGTLLDGTALFRNQHSWRVADERLIIDGIDWNIRFNGDTFTVNRHGFSGEYTYFWYSDSVEGETSFLFVGVLAIIFLVIVAFAVIIIVSAIVLSKRSEQRSIQQMRHLIGKPNDTRL